MACFAEGRFLIFKADFFSTSRLNRSIRAAAQLGGRWPTSSIAYARLSPSCQLPCNKTTRNEKAGSQMAEPASPNAKNSRFLFRFNLDVNSRSHLLKLLQP